MDTNRILSPGVRILITVVGLTILVLIGLSSVGIPVFAGNECKAPEGYQLIENRMAADLAGNPVYVLRAVVATGEGAQGGKSIAVPSCSSPDKKIEEVGNVYIVLDGRQLLLLTGSVGREILPSE